MIPWLADDAPFPPLDQALGPESDAPGLLAASAEIQPERLLEAYRNGIFPWYSDGQPVLWWSPDPRMVLHPAEFKIARSLRKTLQAVLCDEAWEIRVDAGFAAVMRACAVSSRPGQNGTWITPAIVAAYSALHAGGFAHSVESWYRGERVGGLYGVSIGRMFFGESMFSWRTDASKIALAALVAQLQRQQVEMIDCQQNTAHLASLGAREIPRGSFVSHVRAAIAAAPFSWRFDKSVLADVMRNPRGLARDPP